MQNVLLIAQALFSLILVGLILVQARGTGLGKAFGGGGVSFTRRGVEKVVFRSTFVIGTLFILVSVLSIIL